MVEQTGVELENIKIESAFCDAFIGLHKSSTYNVEANLSFGDISYPKGAEIKKTAKSVTSSKFAGTIGSGGSAKTVRISSQYGDVRLGY